MSETKIPTGPPSYYLSQLGQAEKILKMQNLEFFTNINNINNFLNSLKLRLPEKTSPEYNNTLIRKYNEIIALVHKKIIEANYEEDEGAEDELIDLSGLVPLPLPMRPPRANKGGKKRRRRKTKRKRKKSKRKSRKKRKTRRRKK